MWIALATGICVLASIFTLLAAAKAHIQHYTFMSRLDNQDDRIKSLVGKVSADNRWSRDEIRSAVDEYLHSLDIKPGGSDVSSDMLQALMMSQFGGGLPGMMDQGEQQPPEQPAKRPGLYGQGGANSDGQSSGSETGTQSG